MNLLFHLNAKQEANEFKRISTLPRQDLIDKMGVAKLTVNAGEKVIL